MTIPDVLGPIAALAVMGVVAATYFGIIERHAAMAHCLCIGIFIGLMLIGDHYSGQFPGAIMLPLAAYGLYCLLRYLWYYPVALGRLSRINWDPQRGSLTIVKKPPHNKFGLFWRFLQRIFDNVGGFHFHY